MPAVTDLSLFIQAAAFAAEKHRHQRRKNPEASPYINHPLELANVLANEGGVQDIEVLCAALLHDTVEDTQTTPAELRTAFGPAIAAIVAEVTDDKSLPKPERKRLQVEHAAHSSLQAKQVKLADKICNLRDILRSPPVGWSLERQQAYFDWAGEVRAGLQGAQPQLEQILDQLLARRHELG